MRLEDTHQPVFDAAAVKVPVREDGARLLYVLGVETGLVAVVLGAGFVFSVVLLVTRLGFLAVWDEGSKGIPEAVERVRVCERTSHRRRELAQQVLNRRPLRRRKMPCPLAAVAPSDRDLPAGQGFAAEDGGDFGRLVIFEFESDLNRGCFVEVALSAVLDSEPSRILVFDAERVLVGRIEQVERFEQGRLAGLVLADEARHLIVDLDDA